MKHLFVPVTLLVTFVALLASAAPDLTGVQREQVERGADVIWSAWYATDDAGRQEILGIWADAQQANEPMPPDPTEPPATGEPRSSVTSYGITWTFDKQYVAGQYVNGDWWVVGPLTLTKIDPSGATSSGSMLDPDVGQPGGQVAGSRQGFDQMMYELDGRAAQDWGPELNVALQLPKFIDGPASLVSTESRASGLYRPRLQNAAVLTVLDVAPPEGSFRPPYSAGPKDHEWQLDDVDMSLFPSLARPPSAPPAAALAEEVDGVWLRTAPFYLSRDMGPLAHNRSYARDMTWAYGSATLGLCLDYSAAEKEEILIGCVQRGIDFYGIARRAIATSPPDGQGTANELFAAKVPRAAWDFPGAGQSSGYQWPILFLGVVFDRPDIIRVGQMDVGPDGRWTGFGVLYGEAGQTFVVKQTGTTVNFGAPFYTTAHVGLPEWGTGHAIPSRTNRDDARWWPEGGVNESDRYRVCCTMTSWWAQLLSAELIGGGAGRAAWAHEPLFDYARRYREHYAKLGTSKTEQAVNYSPAFGTFPVDCWDLYAKP